MFALPALVPGIEGISEALLNSALLSILAAPPIMWRTRRFERRATAPDANEPLRLSQGSLRERETRLRTILATMPQCVKIVDSDCQLIEMNPAGLALTEASSFDELRGRSVLELVAPEHHDLYREGVAAALAGEQVRQEFEIVGLRGTRRWMEQFSVALGDPIDPDGPSQILSVTGDITDRVATEETLIRARELAASALLETQDLRRAVDEQSFVSIADPSGKIIDVNDTFCRISGYSRDELIGQDHRVHNSGYHPKSFWVQMWKTVAAGELWRGEVCNRAKDGSIYWVNSIVAPFKDGKGRIEKYVSIRTDITDRKIAEERVRQNEAQLREAQRIARIGTWSLDLRTDRLEWSDIIYEIFEIEKDEFGASYEAFFAVVHPEDREAVDAAYKESVQNRTPYSIDHRLLMADGRVKYVHERGETFYDGNGAALCTVGTVQDVTELKEAEVELRSAARTDKLTNLANRALFQERLEQALERSRGDPEYRYAVLFLDLDRFKVVNDSLGHGAGDQLLQRIGDRLRSAVRVSDSLSQTARGHTAARLGGDEFVILLDGLDTAEDATIVAQRLLDMLDEPHRLGRQLVYSPASIGIVTSDTPMESAEEVLRNADIAMYEAKAAGKGCYVIFDTSMHDRIRDRHNLEHDLRGSIDRGELRLVYQPIICLSDGELRGCEALVRWDHPERGVVGPVEFIPIAEDTGFITVLGEWVLWEACRRFASWREEMGERAPRYVSVNVSRSQLMLAGLPELISQVLSETGVPPECLLIEVTESAIMRDVEASKRVLHSLKDVGVKLAIDDFGTGYSSLASLHQFPVDVLKIDRAFVAEIESSREFLALTSAISQLAHSLGITTIAEGIETSDHVIVLQSLDCDMGQGYLFAKPLDGDEILTFTVPEFDLAGIRNDDARKAA